MMQVPSTERVLCIDPGEHAGVSLWESRKDGSALLLVLDCVKGASPREVYFAMRRYAPDRVIVEQVYLPRNRSQAGIRTLVLRAGHWLTLAGAASIPTQEVAPATWQAGVGCSGKGAKERYIAHAQAWLGRDNITEDQAAALCIGLWYLGTKGLEPQQQTE